jgi:hypothetical protein
MELTRFLPSFDMRVKNTGFYDRVDGQGLRVALNTSQILSAAAAAADGHCGSFLSTNPDRTAPFRPHPFPAHYS